MFLIEEESTEKQHDLILSFLLCYIALQPSLKQL